MSQLCVREFVTDQKILEYIEAHREEMVSTLMSLIECPSPDTGDTPAQEIVDRELTSMGFETESFMGSEDLVGTLPDYCPPEPQMPHNF